MSFTVKCDKCGSTWTRVYTEVTTDYVEEPFDSNSLIFKAYHTYIDCKNCGEVEEVDFWVWE